LTSQNRWEKSSRESETGNREQSMEADLLAQILKDIQEIKADIRWFKEREELRQQAIREATENAASGLANVDSTITPLRPDRHVTPVTSVTAALFVSNPTLPLSTMPFAPV
jgi:hypothetical protein